MTRHVSYVITLSVLLPMLVAAQGSSALAPLQGRWVVTAAEHNGKPLDAIKGGVMTIAGDGFEVRTASGNMLKGALTIDPSKQPLQMDMLHADGARWEAIYIIDGETFRLNYIETGGKDVRPTTFTTSAATEATIVTLRRENR